MCLLAAQPRPPAGCPRCGRCGAPRPGPALCLPCHPVQVTFELDLSECDGQVLPAAHLRDATHDMLTPMACHMMDHRWTTWLQSSLVATGLPLCSCQCQMLIMRSGILHTRTDVPLVHGATPFVARTLYLSSTFLCMSAFSGREQCRRMCSAAAACGDSAAGSYLISWLQPLLYFCLLHVDCMQPLCCHLHAGPMQCTAGNWHLRASDGSRCPSPRCLLA